VVPNLDLAGFVRAANASAHQFLQARMHLISGLAQRSRQIVRRVGGFLGVDSFVFPPVSSQNIQPSTVVREVLSDVYDFRNTIAHGLEIPKVPFRERCDVIATDGQRINYEDCCRIDLLLESALFMLTTCLRRMFVENLFDEVKDVEKWRLKMRLYAHRYKNSGGPAATRLRGR
jgi:hypothetical protein